jgi:hypothetical protein
MIRLRFHLEVDRSLTRWVSAELLIAMVNSARIGQSGAQKDCRDGFRSPHDYILARDGGPFPEKQRYQTLHLSQNWRENSHSSSIVNPKDLVYLH